ncbi:hypothetical protein LIER_17751 [Lithospermum erythrorhizon]|uniref:Uncharacterized protein n=1 Tax=Lithospermum erythrorhizon TaxID=34254 RepID=A0AAV3QCV3_LITER
MDEQEISYVFTDRLNSSLYDDEHVYVRERPYVKVASPGPRSESTTTHSSSSSSGDETSSSANSPIPQVTVGDKVASKLPPHNDDLRVSSPIKGTHPTNDSRTHPTSGSGISSTVTQGPIQSVTPAAAERAEASYQCIVTSLPTFIKKSLPSQITLDHLDGFLTYFFIPFDKVDTRLEFHGDQVILPRIEAKSMDPDLIPGYTAVVCRIAGVEPSVSLFLALFTETHENFQTNFRACSNRNILAGKLPNKDPDKRLFKKWFFARGGMAVGVPHIWTLKDEAKPFPSYTDTDVVAANNFLSVLPQETENACKLPKYTFVYRPCWCQRISFMIRNLIPRLKMII